MVVNDRNENKEGPLRRLCHILRRSIRVVLLTLHLLYLPGEARLYTNILVRTLFSLYYIPLIAFGISATHGCFINIVFSQLLPLIEKAPAENDERNIFEVLIDAATFAEHLLPLAVVSMGVATLGHKMINCIAECMVDSFSSYEKIDYALTLRRLEYLSETPFRILITLAVAVSSVFLLMFIFGSDVIMWWSRREPHVIFATVFIISVCLLYVVVTCIMQLEKKESPSSSPFEKRADRCPSPDDIVPRQASSEIFLDPNPAIASPTPSTGNSSDAKKQAAHSFPKAKRATKLPEVLTPHLNLFHLDSFVTRWWSKYIHRIRFFSISQLAIFTLYWMERSGPIDAIAFWVETIVYLNIPFLICSTVLATAVSIDAMFENALWLLKHPRFFPHIFFLVAPYETLLIYTGFYFQFTPLSFALVGGMTVLLVCRAVELCREAIIHPKYGCISWKYGSAKKLVPLQYAIDIEYAWENKQKNPSLVSVEVHVDMPSHRMQLKDKPPQHIERSKRPGDGNYYVSLKHVLKQMLPRMLAMQSAVSQSGRRFVVARTILRVLTFTLMLALVVLVGTVILQATVPQLRPLPVTATVLDNGFLLDVDHVVVGLKVEAARGNKTFAKVNEQAGLSQKDDYFSLCSQSFSSASIWELSWLSLAAYMSTQEAVHELIGFINTHLDTEWEIVSRHTKSKAPVFVHPLAEPQTVKTKHERGWVGLLELYSPRHNLTVITVRGTELTSAMDMLQDLQLFFEVGFWHVLSHIVPGTSALPTKLVVDYIYIASRLDAMWSTLPQLTRRFGAQLWSKLPLEDVEAVERHYHSVVEKRLHEIQAFQKKERRPTNILLTGHSLGGAIGHIVAAKNDIRSVGFSSPGLVLSRKKFGLTLSSIHKNLMTIISTNDIVPHIGGQGGELHHVACSASVGELCHAMEFMVKTIWKHCPSIREKYKSIVRVDVKVDLGANSKIVY